MVGGILGRKCEFDTRKIIELNHLPFFCSCFEEEIIVISSNNVIKSEGLLFPVSLIVAFFDNFLEA